MKKRIKISAILYSIVIVLLIVLGFFIKDIYKNLLASSTSEVEVLSTIDEYGYYLNENDSDYFNSVYKELEKELNNEEIDESNYAELISKLFVIDFYSVNYAVNKNDVGGKQFIYSTYVDNFVNAAKDSIYSTVENNIYGDRNQELPIVKDVEITSVEQDLFETDDVSDEEAYYVDITITYEKDLEYPTTVSLVIVHNNDKLEIAKVN